MIIIDEIPGNVCLLQGETKTDSIHRKNKSFLNFIVKVTVFFLQNIVFFTISLIFELNSSMDKHKFSMRVRFTRTINFNIIISYY